MQKLITAALLLFSSHSMAQEPSMQIGFLKLNQTHTDSVTLQATAFYNSSRHPLKLRRFKIEEISEPDSNNEDYDKLRSTFLPGYRHFRANVLYINDLALYEVSLLFFNDTLIKMNCGIDYELEKVLTYKYGKPKESDKPGKITCRYNFTGTLNNYTTNKNVKIWLYRGCEAVAWTWRDYIECKEFFTSGFSFEVMDKMKIYEKACEVNLKRIQIERKNKITDQMSKY